MKPLRSSLSRIGGLFGKRGRDAELASEFESHVELETEANVRAGMSPGEARRQALIHSGGIESAKEEYRERRGVPVIESVLQDVRYAIRTLRKSPVFLVTALATLALGIGANTAMFSVTRKLLTPVDIEDPSKAVFVWTDNAKRDWHHFPVSIPDFLDWRASGIFSNLSAINDVGVNLRLGERTDRVAALMTTSDLLSLAGIAPLRGRVFAEADTKPGADPVVIIREELWRNQFAGRQDIVGLSAVVDGKNRTIIGVMPKRFPRLQGELLYVPMTLAPPLTTERGSRGYGVLGRLAPGVTIASAQKRINEICVRLASQFEQDHGNLAVLQPMNDGMVEDSESLLVILSAAVGLVLLVACANLASLLLARGAARGKEIALRSALGAGRGRIARQLLTESVLISLTGGLLGLPLAIWGLRFLQSFHLDDSFDLSTISIDWKSIAFMLLLSAVTGIIFGFAPAVHAWRSDVNDILKGSTASVSTGGFMARLRGIFVGTEVAVAMILLVAAGLLLQSLVRLQSEDPGYHAQGILAMRVALSGDAYAKGDQQIRFFDGAVERIAALPGVESAGAADGLPTSTDFHGAPLLFPDRPDPRIEDVPVILRIPVTSNYFATMQEKVVRGRGFNDADRADSTPVVVIDEYTAKQYWPGQDPIGKQIRLGSKKTPIRQVVGVIGNLEQPVILRLVKGRMGDVYLPMRQMPSSDMSIVVRTSGDPAALSASVRGVFRELDPDQPVFEMQPLEAVRKAARAPQQLAATLLDSFAMLAALLAAIGIYGVIAWHVTQRTREFGIRLSLGAQPSEILRIAIRQGLILSGLGVAAGLAVSFVLTRFLVSLLHGVAANDPMTFAGVAIFFLAVAAISSWLPARKAAAIDPSSALRT
ncbi:MAG TPA: ABC transporter permease [Bryobacteraceae bacterium]